MTRVEYWQNTSHSLDWDKMTVFSNIILDLIDGQPKQSSILELGCGQGRNLKHLQDNGYTNLTGVEINQGNVDRAKIDYPNNELNIINDDVFNYLKTCKKHDIIITCSFVYLSGDPTILYKIQDLCKYYIMVEPSPRTYLASCGLFDRVDYYSYLDKMEVEKEIIDISVDRYTGALLKKKKRR
jgi:SAM-dependent methyltransferase